ncbi:MAG: hypothetical protein AB4058_15615 [Microcystaceae cyanobacterium]
MKFTKSLRQKIGSELENYLDQLEEITLIFEEMDQTFLWSPPEDNSHELYDYYLDALVLVYFNKYRILCFSLIQVLNAENYLMYGLIGRAIIEHTAILRYYVTGKMLPLVEKALEDGIVTKEEVEEIIPWLEKHLTGQRFQWQPFLADYLDESTSEPTQQNRQLQVNVITCLEKWIKEEPSITPLYELFCDLVHPNLGSTLLISRKVENQVGIGGSQGEPIGLEIVKRTLSDILQIFEEVKSQLKQIQSFKFAEVLRER